MVYFPANARKRRYAFFLIAGTTDRFTGVRRGGSHTPLLLGIIADVADGAFGALGLFCFAGVAAVQ